MVQTPLRHCLEKAGRSDAERACYWLAQLPPSAVMLASVGAMQLLRDEHQLVGEMVKAQLAMADSGFLDPNPMTAPARRQTIASR